MYGFNCSDLYVNIIFYEGAVNPCLLNACNYKNKKTAPPGTAFNISEIIANYACSLGAKPVLFRAFEIARAAKYARTTLAISFIR